MICRKRTSVPTLPVESRAVRASARLGATMLEMIATTVILGTVATVSLPMLKLITNERRAAVRHEQAITAASNIMERVTAMPYTEITPEFAAKTELADWLQEQLHNPVLTLSVEAAPNDSAKMIQLKLEWQTETGQPVAPIRLTSWVHDHEVQP